MTEQELKAHLAAMQESPGEIETAVKGLDYSMLRYKPAADKWSINEVLAHVADIEILYGHRMRQIIADKDPTIAPIDQNDWARNLGYSDAPPDESLAVYRTNRFANLRLLRRITAGDLTKGAFHPERNRKVTLAELIEMMARHGISHLRQIEQLKRQATG